MALRNNDTSEVNNENSHKLKHSRRTSQSSQVQDTTKNAEQGNSEESSTNNGGSSEPYQFKNEITIHIRDEEVVAPVEDNTNIHKNLVGSCNEFINNKNLTNISDTTPSDDESETNKPSTNEHPNPSNASSAEDGSVKETCNSHTSTTNTPATSESESEIDSDDSAASPKVPLPVLRPGFRPRGRMFKPPAAAAAQPQFIMDVPEMWGVGADGSMMEVFNKLEIKE